MEQGREKAKMTSKGGDDDDIAAAKKGNGFLARPPAPSSLRGRHAQGGDILIPASTNWCESGDRQRAAVLVKTRKAASNNQSARNLTLEILLKNKIFF